MRTLINFLCALVVCVAVLAGSRAWAAAETTNYWIGASGNFTNTANWSSGAAPTKDDRVFFTNGAPITVQFTSSVTNYPLKMYDRSVTFDINGNIWKSNFSTNVGAVGSTIGTNATGLMTVKFSSSTNALVSGGNTIILGTPGDAHHSDNFGLGVAAATRSTQVVVDDSLGYPVKLSVDFASDYLYPGAQVTVSGPGSEFVFGYVNPGSMNGFMLVTNGGLFRSDNGFQVGYAASYATAMVINASMHTSGGYVGGYTGNGVAILSNNSTWTVTGAMQLGLDGIGAGPFRGSVIIDQSTYRGQTMVIGGDNGNGIAAGQFIVNNGSSVTLSNGLLNTFIYPTLGGNATNTFMLNNSTVLIGGGAVSGYVTNYGLIKANGTITGQGAGNFLFWGGSSNGPAFSTTSHFVTNAAILQIGITTGTVGKLVLNKANFQMDPKTRTYFDFSNTGLDQIVVSNGFARLFGSNIFALANGAAIPTNGVKYGLGVYNFVIGTTISNAPQSDNLVFLLTNNYHLVYGVDFQYGVVSLGGGLFALELAFVPEPSTVMLLGLGALLVWRRLAKRGRKPGKAAGAIIAGALILALAGGSALAASNYWVTSGGYSGNFVDTTHWVPAAKPGSSDMVLFTNRQAAGGYTVTLTNSQSINTMQVLDDSMTFDLGGYRLDTAAAVSAIGTGGTYNITVKFSSSSTNKVSGGNIFNWGGYSPSQGSSLGANATLIVDDSLGKPAEVDFGGGLNYLYGNILVSGTNSAFQIYFPNSSLGLPLGTTIVTNQGIFFFGAGTSQLRALRGTVTFYNGIFSNTVLNTQPLYLGYNAAGSASILLTNNSTWYDIDTTILGGVGPDSATMVIDGSTVKARYWQVSDAAGNGASTLKILNGSTAIFTNALYITKQNNTATNLFVLNNSTIKLGTNATPGWLTNNARWFAAGTISGQGSANASVYNGGQLIVGNPINPTTNITVSLVTNVYYSTPGKLVLNKADLTLGANSTNYFQFGDTALSQIVVSNGFARLLGTNIFQLANGAAIPTNGVKYGLGVYDFVIGTSVSNAPQRDNLVFLLTNKYHLVYGVDFQYGVVSLGGGLFALELAFVPEPSTVMLLGLGALLVWRRIAKRGRKTGKATSTLIAGALILALAGGSALAVDHYWVPSGGYSGNFVDTTHWTPATVPGASDQVIFTNRQAAGAYTVSLTNSRSVTALQVYDDSVTYDLGGWRWDTTAVANNIGTGGTYNITVKFSSSSTNKAANGNIFNWANYSPSQGSALGVNANLIVDDSLGNPVEVDYGGGLGALYGTVLVSGTNSTLVCYFGNSFGGSIRNTTIITNKAVFAFGAAQSQPRPIVTGGNLILYNSMFSNSTYNTSATYIGYNAANSGSVTLNNNSTWLDGTVVLVGSTGPGSGTVIMDNSTFSGRYMQVSDAAGNNASTLKILNGSTATFTNALWVTKQNNTATNLFVLNNSTIKLGTNATPGWLTNNARWFAAGTISGQGSANASVVVSNGGQLIVGNFINPTTNITVSLVTNVYYSTPGKLVLNKADLTLMAGSSNYFQFGDTSLSQIVDSNGIVRLLGTNIFQLANGAAIPTNGVKYGLGVYDFVIGTSISNAPQRDNLVFLLTNKYHLVYGVDFQYGVVSLGGGLFALELAFVPEPSTVLLLALGGLLVWRRIAKGSRKSGRTAGALVACGLILALAGGSAWAYNTNYWQNSGSGYSTNWNTTAAWSLGSVPVSTDNVWFSNRQSSAYTVKFTASASSGAIRIFDDNITFDMNGYRWDIAQGVGGTIGTNPAFASVIKFSSSSTNNVVNGNVANLNYGDPYTYYSMGGNTKIIVDDSLGNPVKVQWSFGGGGTMANPASLLVSGTNSEFDIGFPNSGGGFYAPVVITNRAVLAWFQPGVNQSAIIGSATTMVYNSTMRTSVTAQPVYIGNSATRTGLILTNGSLWADSNLSGVPTYVGASAGGTDVELYNSTFTGINMQLGSLTSANGPSWLQILNNSTATFTNRLLVAGWTTRTNSVVLNNSTIKLGGVVTNVTYNGTLAFSNGASFYASGTISGLTSGNAQFYTKGRLFLGDTLSTTGMASLVLNKANAQLDAGSQTYFNFSNADYDRILATNGTVSMLGSNIFSLAPGAPAPHTGEKYGAGVFDFVIATNLTKTTQYDNLVNLLTNTYHLTYGVDFQYGVVNLGNGLFALELTFVPEPSTVMLLALGGLLIWRRMAMRPVASRK